MMFLFMLAQRPTCPIYFIIIIVVFILLLVILFKFFIFFILPVLLSSLQSWNVLMLVKL